jgi:hypothetical protein
MPQPYDYSIGGTDPTEAFLKGVQIAQQGRQAQAEYLRAQAAQAEVDRVGKFQTAVQAVIKDPTPQGWRDLASNFPIEYSKSSGLQKGVDDIDRPAIRSLGRDALMAHRNNNPEMVVKLIDDRIAATTDNPALLKRFQNMKDVYQSYSDNTKLQEGLISSILVEDEEGTRMYNTAFKQTEPYENVPGIGIVLKSDIDRAVAEAEKTGNPDVNVNPIIPEAAVSRLKSGAVTPEKFDSIFGPNSSSKVLGMGGGQPTSASKNITEREANRMRASLGPKGFIEWLRANNIAIVGK